jgi:hypothetical protein
VVVNSAGRTRTTTTSTAHTRDRGVAAAVRGNGQPITSNQRRLPVLSVNGKLLLIRQPANASEFNREEDAPRDALRSATIDLLARDDYFGSAVLLLRLLFPVKSAICSAACG